MCRPCALQAAPCDGLIPDHLRSTVDATDSEAWVVDGFGGAHAIGPKAGIGRNHDCDLVVLASSVSREHAELVQTETGWAVRDLGSRNGTFVNGVCSQGRVALPANAEIASPSAIRGCVPTKQFARDLPFQSKYANQENVRQVVLRLRGVLGEVGAGASSRSRRDAAITSRVASRPPTYPAPA